MSAEGMDMGDAYWHFADCPATEYGGECWCDEIELDLANHGYMEESE